MSEQINTIDKISILTIETAIDLVRLCSTKDKALEVLEEWLRERKEKVS